MFRTTALILALVVYSHVCVANPVPEPGHKSTHIRVHLPYDVHTVHHHHVERVPVVHTVPVVKHVPVFHSVPVVKEVPLVLPVPVPYYGGLDIKHSSWH